MLTPALRPLSSFLADLSASLGRCVRPLLAVSILGWLPALSAFAATLAAGLDLGALAGLVDSARLSNVIDGSEPLAPLTTGSPTVLAIGATLTVVCYLFGQAFVSTASAYLIALASTDRRASARAAIRWSMSRIGRSTGALVVAIVAVGAPVSVLAAALAIGLPWTTVPLLALPVLGLTLLAASRFTLTGTTAAIAPAEVPAVRTSVGAVSGRALVIGLRVVSVSLVVSIVSGAVSLPLLAAGVATGPVVLAVAFAARLVLSLASTTFGLASTVLVYRDLSLPVAADLGEVPSSAPAPS